MRLDSPNWGGGECGVPKGASLGPFEAMAWEVNLVPNKEIMEKCYADKKRADEFRHQDRLRSAGKQSMGEGQSSGCTANGRTASGPCTCFMSVPRTISMACFRSKATTLCGASLRKLNESSRRSWKADDCESSVGCDLVWERLFG